MEPGNSLAVQDLAMAELIVGVKDVRFVDIWSCP